MYDAHADVDVVEMDTDRRIEILWPTPVEWVFSARGDEATLVVITSTEFTCTHDEKVAAAIESMGGFSFLLAGCKAWLEHGLQLNIVADHDPDHDVKQDD
jgi:hypothetical protein